MQFLETKFGIHDSIEHMAALTGSEIQHHQEDLDDVLLIHPKGFLSGTGADYQLFQYANAPGMPVLHLLSTHPSQLDCLAEFLIRLGVEPADIVCETTFDGRPLADIGYLRQKVLQARFSGDQRTGMTPISKNMAIR